MKNVLFLTAVFLLNLSCVLQENETSTPLSLTIGNDDSRAVSFPGTRFTDLEQVETLVLTVMNPDGDVIKESTLLNPTFPSQFNLDLESGKPYLLKIEAFNSEPTVLALNYRTVFLDGTQQTLRMPLMAGLRNLHDTFDGATVTTKGLEIRAVFMSSPGTLYFTPTSDPILGSSYSINGNSWIPKEVENGEYNIDITYSPFPTVLRIRFPDGVGGFYMYVMTII